MPYDKKLEQYHIAQTNKYNAFRCIQKRAVNRAAVARELGLSIPTVMAIVDELLQKGILRSEGKVESAGVGKQPEIVAIAPDSFFYFGCDVGRSAIRVVVNNAAGTEVAVAHKTTGDTVPEKAFIAQVKRFILNFMKKIAINPDKILGGGIAMPGLIELSSGKVIMAPDFGWKDIPLQEWLQRGVPYPVIVRNSTQALAVNESGFSGSEEVHTTLCVNLGYGIGAAMIIGDELYDGSGGISGELGHCVVDRDGPLCKCGNTGCLEAVSSAEAVARQARTIVSHHAPSLMAGLCGGDVEKIDAKMVFEAAEAGDGPALKIVNSAAMYIGMGISMAVNILDPDRVVLCGGLMRNGCAFFEQIKAAMDEHLIARASRKLVLSAGTLDEYSTARGASRMLLNTLWSQRRLPI